MRDDAQPELPLPKVDNPSNPTPEVLPSRGTSNTIYLFTISAVPLIHLFLAKLLGVNLLLLEPWWSSIRFLACSFFLRTLRSFLIDWLIASKSELKVLSVKWSADNVHCISSAVTVYAIAVSTKRGSWTDGDLGASIGLGFVSIFVGLVAINVCELSFCSS